MVTSASAVSRPTIIVNGAREVVDMTPAVGWGLALSTAVTLLLVPAPARKIGQPPTQE